MMKLMSHQQSQAAASLTLPRPEVPTFSGDPLNYCTFISSFENLIESKTDSSSSRLHFLVQYTSGNVKELMQSCLAMDPVVGYQEAIKLLKKRYGQDYRIATAYVERITQGSAIRSEDSNSLQRLSVLLTSCMNTLQNIGYINKIENPDSLRLVIGRLPYELRKRWHARADRISEDENREIMFEDVVKFVEREARAASHPIFGDISGVKDQTERKHSNNTRRQSFTSQVATKEHVTKTEIRQENSHYY
jgi:hypothetical protein